MMRKWIIVLGAVGLCVSACSKENLSERYRTAVHEAAGDMPEEHIHDTTVLFTAVEVPEDYDWRRDTLGGVFNGRLVLFKNFERVLELEISPENEISPEYDTHFLIGGHLCTVFHSDKATTVKCDGNTVLRTAGGEKLLGLLPSGNGIYSLCEKDSGGVFTLRLNDSPILKVSGDAVFGSMNDDCCDPGGALYSDEGKIYFCYRATVAGETAYYVVENGNVCVLSPPMDCKSHLIRDIKVENGKVNYLTISGHRIHVFRDGVAVQYEPCNAKGKYYDGRLLRKRGITVAVGEYHFSYTIFGRTLYYNPERKKNFSFSADMFVIPGTSGAAMLVNWPDKTHQMVELKSSGGSGIHDTCHCFTHRCAFSLGTRTYLALTPVERGKKPYIWVKKDTTEVNVNGYLTAISVKDSVTMTPAGYHQLQL